VKTNYSTFENKMIKRMKFEKHVVKGR